MSETSEYEKLTTPETALKDVLAEARARDLVTDLQKIRALSGHYESQTKQEHMAALFEIRLTVESLLRALLKGKGHEQG